MSVDPAHATEFLREKYRRKREQRNRLYEQAASDFERMVSYIRSNYPYVKVYQWGSVLHPEEFDENSDIDIAVERCTSAEMWFKIYGELDKMTEFYLDLVELDRIDPDSRSSILSKGKLVYDPEE
jgi:predicted nucleotidyltransferase